MSTPAYPNIKGLDQFKGVTFHSQDWQHDYPLEGKKVAVIGTGASAIQFVPQIVPKVGRLDLYQRTPPWIMPKPDRAITSAERALFKYAPKTQEAMRNAIYLQLESRVLGFVVNPQIMKLAELQARRHIRQSIKDPALRKKVTPDYTFGCKRVLISNDYLPSLAQPNVDVITHGIKEVRANSIIGDDGQERQVDAIIFGTGFETRQLPLTDQLFGTDGVSMAESWNGDPAAYLGTSVQGFPNCYLMHGPNIGLGHNSVVHMLESQANYIAATVTYARDFGFAAVEPTPSAQQTYDDDVQRLSDGTVWTAGGCQSWYVNSRGRNVNIWPSSTIDFRRRTSRFIPADHKVTRPSRKLVEA